MNIQTGDEDGVARRQPTNFSVVRVKRDILRAQQHRRDDHQSLGSVAAAGIEPGLRRRRGVLLLPERRRRRVLRAHRDAGTRTATTDSYQGSSTTARDRYGAHLEYLKVGDNFNPEVGFVSRDNFRRTYGTLRFSPRPKSIKSVRKFTYQANFDNFVNGGGALETRIETGQFSTEFENSDVLASASTREFELLQRPTPVAGVTFPAGELRRSPTRW